MHESCRDRVGGKAGSPHQAVKVDRPAPHRFQQTDPDRVGFRDRRGAEMLFQVLTEREEKASVAIASNESFGGWTKTFTDPRLCAATLA